MIEDYAHQDPQERLTDDVDSANNLTAIAMAVQVGKIREQAQKPEVEATGFCLFCEEELDDDRRWCDSECRDDWEREKARQ